MSEKNSSLFNELGGTIKVHILFAAKNHIVVFCNDNVLTPERSQHVYNHSPNGFSVGYNGSCCAQLALALLLEATNDETLSIKFHQQFKEEFVSQWKHGEDDVVATVNVKEWLCKEIEERYSANGSHTFPFYLADEKGYYKIISPAEYIFINVFGNSPQRLERRNYGEELSPLFIRYFKTFACGGNDEHNLEDLPDTAFYDALTTELNEYQKEFPAMKV